MRDKQIPFDIKEQELYYATCRLKDAIETYGMYDVVQSMDEATYWHFFKWFHAQ